MTCCQISKIEIPKIIHQKSHYERRFFVDIKSCRQSLNFQDLEIADYNCDPNPEFKMAKEDLSVEMEPMTNRGVSFD
jgi:hypothetical protein